MIKLRFRFIALMVLILAGIGSEAYARSYTYNLIDLGTVGSDTASYAASVNNSGTVVGTSVAADGSTQGFTWSKWWPNNGSMLGLSNGNKQTTAIAIDSSGVILGNSTSNSGKTEPGLWRSYNTNYMQKLYNGSTIAYNINDNGQILASNGDPSQTMVYSIWGGHNPVKAGGDMEIKYASDVNTSGHVIGETSLGTPYIWDMYNNSTELKSRLQKTLPRNVDIREMIASTFHSLAVQIIRRDAKLLGYKKYFSIADQGEQYAIIRKAARHVTGCSKLRPEEMLAEISRLKSKGISHQEFALRAIDDWEISLASVYRRYQDQLRFRNSMDFDDLLIKSLELLTTHPEPREYWQKRFRYIMVDEFQDTSGIQNELVKVLAGKWGNLCVVGDDDQSIYSWRGAVPENILRFHHNWKNAKVVYLEENYRSTNAILQTANAVITNNTDRHPKTLWSNLGTGNKVRYIECSDQQHEAEYIVTEIKRRQREEQLSLADFAIIVRANALTRTFEGELATERIPYEVIGGQSFFDIKEVRDILAFLSAIDNPDDDGALMRIINIPARGIGEKTIEHLLIQAQKKHRSVNSLLPQASEIPEIPAKAVASCKNLAEMLDKWREELSANGTENIVESIIRDTRYEEELEHLYDDPLQRASRMESALAVADSIRSSADSDDLSAFLQEATLSWREQNKDKGRESADSVKIITIHSAKGLEYRNVFIAGVEEGIIPHHSAEEEGTVEEERRLFYVAITRARVELTITRCLNRLQRGKHSAKEPSRFISEIPQELLEKETPASYDSEEREDILAAIRAAMEQR